MTEKIQSLDNGGNVGTVAVENDPPAQSAETSSATAGAQGPASEPKVVAWPAFLKTATQQAIKDRIAAELSDVLKKQGLEQECGLAILEPQDSIDTYDLDQIFTALKQLSPHRNKRVVLFILSSGGSAEPAYQISKLCKSFSLGRFIVVVPRQAKSAATMVAIGADEIHMGPLGQLGPIDPQIGGLPALGVSQALKTIASVSEMYPGSADMFAAYLQKALTVEQIGYCDRISESAVQYAQRLLSTKPHLIAKAPTIAKELVHEYKDHGFVIDLDEARKHLGEEWIKTDTPELAAGELIYSHFETVNFHLAIGVSKRFMLCGAVGLPSSILIFNKKAPAS